MTDPVDTDSLRAITRDRNDVLSAWEVDAVNAAADDVDRLEVELRTARTGLGFMADMHERRRVKLERTESENEALRAMIENAPHREKCRPHIACTCWKADTL